MKKLIAALLIAAAMLVGCGGESKSEPPQAKAWCEYNDIRNKTYREYVQRDEAEHPYRKSVPSEHTHKLVQQIEQTLKPERERLFGKISDEDFDLIDARSVSQDWYQNYCGH